jgi:hypothetical protein
MTLRIFSVLFAASFLFGTAGSVNAAEQVTHQSKSASEMSASSFTKKKDFKPRKPKKTKPRKRHCDAY